MPNSGDPTFIDPVTINILVVADGRLRFDVNGGKDAYSLSLMIEGINQAAGPVVRFTITTAYRIPKEHIRKPGGPQGPDSNGEGSDFPDFKFTGNSLRQSYDEIWIFGDQSEELDENDKPKILTTQLVDSEAGLVREFMQEGGGCFATGDHESLGASINGHLPRVRSMRVWHKGPPAGGADQNDSRPENIEKAEEDTTPQKLAPRMYRAPNSSTYPHPLLNGSTGVIGVLPDHMHEGVCRENQTPSELLEYSARGDLKPLVIADSDSHSSAPHKFGAIGAYDGHLADVGRIVVDASFHHFVNDNLEGFSRKARTYSGGELDKGVYAYQDIRRYYQNIAIWLAPPEKQREMFTRALWEVRWRSRVYGLFLPSTGAIDVRNIDPARDSSVILNVGKKARAALEQLSSPSLSFLWSIETFGKLTGNNPPFSSLYPWLAAQVAPRNSASDSDGINGEYVIEYLIGGVMIMIGIKFPGKPTEAISNLADELKEILRKGVDLGLRAYRSSLTS